jgi:tetratricopeptide (TPR) repeat protein
MRQLLILLLLAPSAAARKTSITPEMHKLLIDGLDAVYSMDFDVADVLAAKAIALDPLYPHAYLGQAANDLIRFSYGTEQGDPSLIKSFEAKTARTIEVADAWLKAHPNDPDVLLVRGSAHGVAGRMAIVRGQWLRAFKHGRVSMKSVRRAKALDPELYDAYLGLGMFDYYVDTIPRFAGWLAKVMLGGDRRRGIEELTIAAEKGVYGKTAAQLILTEIFTEDDFGGRNPPEAMRLIRGIVAQYPNSAMLHSVLIVSLYEDGKIDEAIKEAGKFQDQVKAGRYPPMALAKSHAQLGTVLWASGEKMRALKEFLSGAEARGGGVRTRWMVWSRVRAGQLFDALGRRAEALAAYRAAYAEADDWGYRALIKPCLKSPCVGEKYPGHFSPY